MGRATDRRRPANAVAAVADLVRDATPGRLEAPGVWAVLSEKYGKSRRTWSLDRTLRTRVDELNESFLAPLRSVRLRHPLDRPQVSEAQAPLDREDLDGILLTGSAGSGKSDVTLQVIDSVLAESFAEWLCIHTIWRARSTGVGAGRPRMTRRLWLPALLGLPLYAASRAKPQGARRNIHGIDDPVGGRRLPPRDACGRDRIRRG
jgi:hypothetical protein